MTDSVHRWGPPIRLYRCMRRRLLLPHRSRRWSKDWRRTSCSWLWRKDKNWILKTDENHKKKGLWVKFEEYETKRDNIQPKMSYNSFSKKADVKVSFKFEHKRIKALTYVAGVPAPSGKAGTAEGVAVVIAGSSVTAGGLITLTLTWDKQALIHGRLAWTKGRPQEESLTHGNDTSSPSSCSHSRSKSRWPDRRSGRRFYMGCVCIRSPLTEKGVQFFRRKKCFGTKRRRGTHRGHRVHLPSRLDRSTGRSWPRRCRFPHSCRGCWCSHLYLQKDISIWKKSDFETFLH